MPSKYSHSVVLADFSTRGVISLPDEQRVKYTNAYRKQQDHPASNVRGRSTEAAQVASRPISISRQGWDARTSDRPHPSLTNQRTPSRTRINVKIDANNVEARPQRVSQAHEQTSRSIPPTSVRGQANPGIVYERQQQQQQHHHHAAQSNSAAPGPARSTRPPASKRASSYLKPEDVPPRPAFRTSRSHPSPVEDVAKARQRDQSPRPGLGETSSSETLAASSTRLVANAPKTPVKEASSSYHNASTTDTENNHADASGHSDERLTPPIWRCVTTPEDETRRAKQEQMLKEQAQKDGRVTPPIWRCVTTPEDETRRAKQEQILREQAQKDGRMTPEDASMRATQEQVMKSQVQEKMLQVKPESANSKESRLSGSTQIWNPQPNVLQEFDSYDFTSQQEYSEEPDFDGFTDDEEPPASYFDLPKRTESHSKSSSHDSSLIIQRPGTREGLKTEDHKSNAPPTALSRASSTTTADRSTHSRATVSSTTASSQGWRSNTPASTVSIPNSYIRSSENTASPRKDVRAPIGRSWRLPEIDEDRGFSPSIFEDREGSNNDFRKLGVFDAGKSIGRISSGKDATVNDAASELIAALPPPITRFRDDEQEFNANKARLRGEGGDYGTSKKGSQIVDRPAVKKEKKGFFSRFKSWNQPQRK